MDNDLLNPSFENQKRTHKLKRIVKAPNSFYIDVKCSGCKLVTPVFSHAQGKIHCLSCNQELGHSEGGRLVLAVGNQFKVKS